MEEAEPSDKPSLLRALWHSFIAFVLIAIAAIAYFVTQEGMDPEKAGYFAGRIAFVVAGFVFGGSYLNQERTYKQQSTWRRCVAIGVVVFLVLGTVNAPNRYAPEKLSEDERKALVVVQNPEKRLSHPYLGFSFLRPEDSYKEMPPEFSATFSKGFDKAFGKDKHMTYIFMSLEGESLILVFSKMDPSEVFFKDMMKGAADSIKEHNGKVEQQEVIWQGERHEAQFRATSPQGSTFMKAFVVKTGPEKQNYLMYFTATTQTPGALDKVIESFQP
jgi:hypothetical protein